MGEEKQPELTQEQLERLHMWNVVIALENARIKNKLPINWMRTKLKEARKATGRDKPFIRRYFKNAIKLNDANLSYWVLDIVNAAVKSVTPPTQEEQEQAA